MTERSSGYRWQLQSLVAEADPARRREFWHQCLLAVVATPSVELVHDIEIDNGRVSISIAFASADDASLIEASSGLEAALDSVRDLVAFVRRPARSDTHYGQPPIRMHRIVRTLPLSTSTEVGFRPLPAEQDLLWHTPPLGLPHGTDDQLVGVMHRQREPVLSRVRVRSAPMNECTRQRLEHDLARLRSEAGEDPVFRDLLDQYELRLQDPRLFAVDWSLHGGASPSLVETLRSRIGTRVFADGRHTPGHSIHPSPPAPPSAELGLGSYSLEDGLSLLWLPCVRHPGSLGASGHHHRRQRFADRLSDPVEGVVLGNAQSNGRSRTVAIPSSDRSRHLYVVGKTGVGKSEFIKNAALQDMRAGHGCCVIDPHGDLVEDILGLVPKSRVDDVVLVDPSDPVAVVGINLLEAESELQQSFIVAELCLMLYELYDPKRQGIIGPRFESLLRNTVLAYMSIPELGATWLDVPSALVDRRIQKLLAERVEHPYVREFWTKELPQTSDYHRSEVLGWFRSKFEPFRTTPAVRRLVGQSRSTFSFNDVLADGRILLVNLSKGRLGQYNSRLVGFVVMTKLWAAALERAQHREGRRPFYLYVDEFQAVTTETLPTMLAEARKFNVGITLANQFFTQINEPTRDAIIGNVGAVMAFRLGHRDSREFAALLGGDVTAAELERLPNYEALASLSVDGIPAEPITIRTLPPAEGWSAERAQQVRVRSREQWATPVAEIEEAIVGRWTKHLPEPPRPRVAASGPRRLTPVTDDEEPTADDESSELDESA